MIVRVDKRLAPPAKLMEGLGVTERGQVQQFATARILHHMRAFMPWLSGTTASALTMQAGPAMIVVNAPYARYLYMGSKMRDPDGGGPFPVKDEAGSVEGFRYRRGAHPVATGVPLSYTHATNPAAGDHWDRTLVEQRGEQIAREIEEFARRRR